MEEDVPDILDMLQRRTEALVAQRLRSVSIVIARLHDLIAEAHRVGHSHAAIHARLRAGGLQASWDNYRVCLVRARRRQMRTAPEVGGGERVAVPARSHAPGTMAASVDAVSPTASPTPVLDALAHAQRAASRDYAQVTRDLRRKARP